MWAANWRSPTSPPPGFSHNMRDLCRHFAETGSKKRKINDKQINGMDLGLPKIQFNLAISWGPGPKTEAGEGKKSQHFAGRRDPCTDN